MVKTKCNKFDCAFIDNNGYCKADEIEIDTLINKDGEPVYVCKTAKNVCNWTDCKFNKTENGGNFCTVENKINPDICPLAKEVATEYEEYVSGYSEECSYD